MHNLIVYGGSFDPLHLGHLNTALAVQNEFQFERFLFLPCKTPVLKEASVASTEQRVEMLKRALGPHPDFEIDLREIKRNTPSFMVNTLESLREEFGVDTAITLLIGMDAFIQLPQWYNWGKILQLSHLLVIKRPTITENQIPAILQKLLSTHETSKKNDLLTKSYGKILRYDAGEYDISSTWLREQIKQGKNIKDCLPEAVYRYIKEHDLYHKG